MAAEKIPITPDVIRWARVSAGYHQIDVAAKKLGYKVDTIDAIEAGTSEPTIVQLRKMAALYKRPLAVLLLPVQPKDFDAQRDLRILKDSERKLWSPALNTEYRRALSQREVILELEEVYPSSVPKSKKSAVINSKFNVDEAAEKIRDLLEMDQWKYETKVNPGKSLNAAIDAVEDLGILVVQTKGVSTEEMRGISISVWPHPVVMLNGSDGVRARLFTLLHELGHLVRNNGALCDLHDLTKKHNTSDDIEEHECNQIAARALMPKKLLEADKRIAEVTRWTTDELYAISRTYSSSSEAFLLRLIDLKVTGWDDWKRLKPELDKIYQDELKKKEEKRKEGRGGGPSFYVVKARDLGHGYIHSVVDAFNARTITSYDAVSYLDIKFNQLGELVKATRI